ncbi:MAG: phosphate ABC transporter substrate-binding protein [Candidatus Didemnitutus sp.]|nr:phosphate ABC transporter substrate-binding protein [Candidatus Didemnitutus sp.]
MKTSFINTLLGLLALSSALHASPLRVQGSTTVNPVVAEAAEVLRAERSLIIQVDTLGGSSGGLTALGEGRVEIAMSSKPVAAADRERHPAVAFHPVHIGEDAVALIVSHDVWEGGVRAVTREQLQGIYERRITNWKALGGPDRRIVFFNKEPGRGTWEVFAAWLYGKASAAPSVAHPEVGANEEARSKVAGTRGALSQLSFSWVDGETIHALGIRATAEAEPVFPSAATIKAGTYPLSRPLFVVTDGEPAGAAKELIDYLLAAPGQALVRKHGYLALADLAVSENP